MTAAEDDRSARTHRALTELRRSSPVLKTHERVCLVASHAEASDVLREHRTFVGQDPDAEPPAADRLSLLRMEAEHHSSVRSVLLFTGFAREALQRAEPEIRSACRRLASVLARRRQAELMADFVRPLTREAMAQVVGLPEADRERIYGWITEVKHDDTTAPPEFRGRASRNAMDAFTDYVLREAEQRRAADDPPDDVITRLVRGTDADGRPLTDGELVMLMRMLCQAGIGSITSLLGNVLYELLREPGRYRGLWENRELVPIAIEESLRHDPPVQMVSRVCVHERSLRGVELKRGDRVVVNIASANRDEALYGDGEEFDLARGRVTDHLAFGRGRHRCVGAAHARTIGTLALNALLDCVPELSLAPGFRYEVADYKGRAPRRLDVRVG